MAYYVNLSLSGGSHSGASGDPYSLDNWLTNITITPAATYYIKGIGAFNSASYVTSTNHLYLCWDKSVDSNGVDAPWRISVTGELDLLHESKIEGAIIQNDSDMYFKGVEFNNCYFIGRNSIIVGQVGVGCTIKGCTFKFSGIYGTLSFNNIPSTVVDSLINVYSLISVSSTTFNNCASNKSLISSGGGSNNQDNWVPTTTFPVSYTDSQSAFSNASLSVGINTPPEPGIPPYSGYDKGLWRTPRTGIGAVDFIVIDHGTARIETYDYKTGSIIDTNASNIEFGDIIQGQHTYKPIVLRFINNSVNFVSPIKIYLESKGGWTNAQFGIFTNSTFIPNIESGSPQLSTHMVEVPGATETSPDGVSVPFTLKTSYYVWLDIDIPVTQDGVAGINYRIFF